VELWLVFRNGPFEQLLELIRFEQIGLPNKIVQNVANALQGQGFANEPVDFEVSRWGDVFALVTEFLEQFFAGPEAGKFDPNILVRHTAGELNQLPGKVQYFDGLAHIEQEDFSTPALGSALKNQSDGLRYGHEVTCHLRVSDFDRAAGGDLFVEERNDAA